MINSLRYVFIYQYAGHFIQKDTVSSSIESFAEIKKKHYINWIPLVN